MNIYLFLYTKSVTFVFIILINFDEVLALVEVGIQPENGVPDGSEIRVVTDVLIVVIVVVGCVGRQNWDQPEKIAHVKGNVGWELISGMIFVTFNYADCSPNQESEKVHVFSKN